MTHVACTSKYDQLRDQPCPENWVAMEHVVVYYARAAQALNAGIKCRHCSSPFLFFVRHLLKRIAQTFMKESFFVHADVTDSLNDDKK